MQWAQPLTAAAPCATSSCCSSSAGGEHCPKGWCASPRTACCVLPHKDCDSCLPLTLGSGEALSARSQAQPDAAPSEVLLCRLHVQRKKMCKPRVQGAGTAAAHKAQPGSPSLAAQQ